MIFLNKNEIKLDNRLSLCAEFVRSGSKVADIGTDHAYLPVYLVKNGIAESAIAADINPGPLKSGADTINRFGLSGQIQTRLSNGLEKISPSECDDIVIAGMGGELICSIISNAAWLKCSAKRLILQPMTRPETLRSFLYANGFDILTEKAVACDKRLYTVMLVQYCGEVKALDCFSAIIGKLRPDLNKPDKEYLERSLSSLKKQQNGLLLGNNKEKAAALTDTINKLINYIAGGSNDENQ